MALERLQKLLSRRGLASRREAEAWILAGRVVVNGSPVRELGTRVDPSKDRVEVDGIPIPGERPPVVVLLHKPAGYVTTVRDPHAERTVMELLSGLGRRVYPVGRLDKDTRGVLVLTDDGDLAHALLHPSQGVEKVYEVTATGDLDEGSLSRLEQGVELEDGHVTKPVRLWRIERTAGGVRFRMSLKEGHKRQVRHMLRAVGGRVIDLVRISFGGITAEGVPEGTWRILRREEVEQLRRGGSRPRGREGTTHGAGARKRAAAGARRAKRPAVSAKVTRPAKAAGGGRRAGAGTDRRRRGQGQ